MKRKRIKKIDNKESAVKYIQMVLNEWDAWKEHHVLLVQALEILLRSESSERSKK